jgi:hypothetical protein
LRACGFGFKLFQKNHLTHFNKERQIQCENLAINILQIKNRRFSSRADLKLVYNQESIAIFGDCG